jgi:hypothetical protein
MVGIGGASEFLRVARVAIRWRAREDVVDMALNARDAHMSADQPKRRPVVIDLGPIRRNCAMSMALVKLCAPVSGNGVLL